MGRAREREGERDLAHALHDSLGGATEGLGEVAVQVKDQREVDVPAASKESTSLQHQKAIRGLGSRVQGLGCRVQGLGFGVWVVGLKVLGLATGTMTSESE